MDTTTIPNDIIGDILTILWESGMFDDLKKTTQKWLVDSELNKLIEMDKPRLTTRLNGDEYVAAIMQAFDVPKPQRAFYETIARVAYMMILAEKNPVVAKDMKSGATSSSYIKQLATGG